MKHLGKILGKLEHDGLESLPGVSGYYKEIAELQRKIHERIPRENYNTAETATGAEVRQEIFNGVNHRRAVIFLLSNGCEWALKNAHGCTMCGHIAKQTRNNNMIAWKDYVNQFDSQFRTLDFKKYPLLNVFNNGSFLNDNEIPPQSRVEMLKRIAEQDDIKMLVVESRPEFVTEEKVKEIKQLLPGKYVEIAIGLETRNDLYRMVCLNKGFSLKQYQEAARIVRSHLNLRTYVLLKPPFLTEQESIDEAVDTIAYAMETGSSTVSLESCTVQEYTIIEALHKRGLYTPPFLWSILEVVKRCRKYQDRQQKQGKLVVGLFQFYPSPVRVPYNCDRCSETIMQALQRYNQTLAPSTLEGFSCSCREQFQRLVAEDTIPFEQRLKLSIQACKSPIP